MLGYRLLAFLDGLRLGISILLKPRRATVTRQCPSLQIRRTSTLHFLKYAACLKPGSPSFPSCWSLARVIANTNNNPRLPCAQHCLPIPAGARLLAAKPLHLCGEPGPGPWDSLSPTAITKNACSPTSALSMSSNAPVVLRLQMVWSISSSRASKDVQYPYIPKYNPYHSEKGTCRTGRGSRCCGSAAAIGPASASGRGPSRVRA